MNYVEWLRVRNCLRVTAIVLGVLVLVALTLRISFNRYMNYDSWIAHMQDRSNAKITHSVLPDGTKRTIVEDSADATRIVVDDMGGGRRHTVITEPSKSAHDNRDHVSIGSINVRTTRDGGISTTTVDTNSSVPLIFYMGFADITALIVATLLGAPFARENDGHLEVALTKPASRTRLAVGAMLADIAGILGASLLTVIAFYLIQLTFGSTQLDVSGVNLSGVLMGIVLPLSWYALLCAATASMRRGYGAVLGFAWPVALLVVVLASVPTTTMLGLAVHDTFWLISRFDPLTYASLHVSEGDPQANAAMASFAARYLTIVGLFALYSVAAVLQWRRVEA